jgi:hypothetical protein
MMWIQVRKKVYFNVKIATVSKMSWIWILERYRIC